MTDAEWIESLAQQNTPEKILRVIVDNTDYFEDRYYTELKRAMLAQAEKVLGERS